MFCAHWTWRRETSRYGVVIAGSRVIRSRSCPDSHNPAEDRRKHPSGGILHRTSLEHTATVPMHASPRPRRADLACGLVRVSCGLAVYRCSGLAESLNTSPSSRRRKQWRVWSLAATTADAEIGHSPSYAVSEPDYATSFCSSNCVDSDAWDDS